MTKTETLRKLAETLDYDPETGTLENGPKTAKDIANLEEELCGNVDLLLARIGEWDMATEFQRVCDEFRAVSLGR
jgi:hypothetical protein